MAVGERLDHSARTIAMIQQGAATEGRELSQKDKALISFLSAEGVLLDGLVNPSPEVRKAMNEALDALWQGSPEAHVAAMGLRRKAAGLPW